VADADGSSGTAAATVIVAAPPPLFVGANVLPPLAVTTGQPLSGILAIFADPSGSQLVGGSVGPDGSVTGAVPLDPFGNYAATIDWGDATAPSAGLVVLQDFSSYGFPAVTGSHTYAVAGTYTVTVTVADADGSSGAIVTTVAVAAPVALDVIPRALIATAG